MSYTSRSRATKGCSLDFGEGTICALYGKECPYREHVRRCSFYQQYLVSEIEQERKETKGLQKLVKSLRLKRNV